VSGEGIATVLKQTAAYDTMLSAANDHIVLENLKINANSLGYSTIKYTNGSDYGRISNCFMHDPLIRGITCDTVTDMVIENNKIIDSGGNGIVLEGTSNRGLVQGNSVINPGQYGIRFWNGTIYSTMVGNFVKNATAFGLAVHTSNHCSVSANIVDSCGLDNINIDNADYVVVTGNNSYNCEESGIVFFNNCNYAAITGNICDYNNHMGFNLDGLRYSTISGNMARRNSRVGLNTWSGIQLHHGGAYQTTIHNSVCGNVSTGSNQLYGIEIAASTDNYQVVVGNNCYGNATGGVHNPTANSEVAHNLS
jgi:parallel beta-helix repeat protein